MSENVFKGYDLFNDIEDENLRNRNRAIVLTNIAEDRTRNQKISPNGAALILGYFKNIPDADKKDVEARFKQEMKQRGYLITAGA